MCKINRIYHPSFWKPITFQLRIRNIFWSEIFENWLRLLKLCPESCPGVGYSPSRLRCLVIAVSLQWAFLCASFAGSRFLLGNQYLLLDREGLGLLIFCFRSTWEKWESKNFNTVWRWQWDPQKPRIAWSGKNTVLVAKGDVFWRRVNSPIKSQVGDVSERALCLNSFSVELSLKFKHLIYLILM